jgi:hypothetical protein
LRSPHLSTSVSQTLNPFDNPISTIERGIVFLHARWSGPSAMALNRLRLAITAAKIPSDALHVIDLDESPGVYNVPELSGRIHGWGEAFFIRDSAISAFRILARDKRTLDEEIRRLLNDNPR